MVRLVPRERAKSRTFFVDGVPREWAFIGTVLQTSGHQIGGPSAEPDLRGAGSRLHPCNGLATSHRGVRGRGLLVRNHGRIPALSHQFRICEQPNRERDDHMYHLVPYEPSFIHAGRRLRRRICSDSVLLASDDEPQDVHKDGL